MTHRAAIDLVLRSAESHANGHEHCLKIHQAVAKVRELLEVAGLGKKKENHAT